MDRLVLNPAELAASIAYRHASTNSLSQETIESTIEKLDEAATHLKLLDKDYWVQASRGITMPVELPTDPEEAVQIIDFTDTKVYFRGRFVCYSQVAIARIIGASTIHALCLVFDGATLSPETRRIPEDHLLHIPVLAVNDIDRVTSLSL